MENRIPSGISETHQQVTESDDQKESSSMNNQKLESSSSSESCESQSRDSPSHKLGKSESIDLCKRDSEFPEIVQTDINRPGKEAINVGDETQSCPACEDICLEDFEMGDLSDSHDSAMDEVPQSPGSLGFSNEVSVEETEDNILISQERTPSPPCVLRHRLDPEPPRSENTDSAAEEEGKFSLIEYYVHSLGIHYANGYNKRFKMIVGEIRSTKNKASQT